MAVENLSSFSISFCYVPEVFLAKYIMTIPLPEKLTLTNIPPKTKLMAGFGDSVPFEVVPFHTEDSFHDNAATNDIGKQKTTNMTVEKRPFEFEDVSLIKNAEIPF